MKKVIIGFQKHREFPIFFLVIFITCLFSCDIYSYLYTEYTIEIVNNSEYDIIKVNISKDDEVIQTDTEAIEEESSRVYTVTERYTYLVEGTLSNAATFSNEVDFSDIEKKIIEVE